MAVRVRYGPEADLVQQTAYQAGQGRYRQNQDRLEEQQRQFDVVQDLRERQFGEQQRQFDEAQQFRRAGLASQISQQRQNRLFAAQQQAGRMFENERRLQLGAAMEAQRNEARLLEQQMQDEARLAAEAMQTDRAQQERAYKQFAVQQGWMKADAQFVDEEASEAFGPIQKQFNQLQPDAQKRFLDLQEKLRNVRRQRGSALRDGQYVHAMNNILQEFEAEGFGDRIQEPRPMEEVINQETFEAHGMAWFRQPDGKLESRPLPKADTPKTVFNDPDLRYKRIADMQDLIFKERKAQYDHAMKVHSSGENAFDMSSAPQPPSYPTFQEAAGLLGQYEGVSNAFGSGEPMPVQEQPEEQWSGTGDMPDDPVVPPVDMSPGDIARIYPGKWVLINGVPLRAPSPQ